MSMTTELAQREKSILLIVAARIARREHFKPIHELCELPQRVISTRALRQAVERAEENLMREVSKIVDGHDRLTKKLEAAEKRGADMEVACELYAESKLAQIKLEAALEKAQQRIAELEARTVKLPRRSVGEVMYMSGFSRDYAEGWCAGNDNAIHEIKQIGIAMEGE